MDGITRWNAFAGWDWAAELSAGIGLRRNIYLSTDSNSYWRKYWLPVPCNPSGGLERPSSTPTNLLTPAHPSTVYSHLVIHRGPQMDIGLPVDASINGIYLGSFLGFLFMVN